MGFAFSSNWGGGGAGYVVLDIHHGNEVAPELFLPHEFSCHE